MSITTYYANYCGLEIIVKILFMLPMYTGYLQRISRNTTSFDMKTTGFLLNRIRTYKHWHTTGKEQDYYLFTGLVTG